MSKLYLRDLVERVAATFVEAFCGVLILGDTLNVSTAEAAGAAGLIAVLTVVKGAAAKFLGNRNTASLTD